MKHVSLLTLAMVVLMTACSTITNPTATYSGPIQPTNPSPAVTVALTLAPGTAAATLTTSTAVANLQNTPGASNGNTSPNSTAEVANPGQVPGSAIGSLPTATNGGGLAPLPTTINATTSATGNATASGTQAAFVDACSLLSAADIESALGTSAVQQPATASAAGSASTCIYTTSGNTPSSVTITVYVSEAEIGDVRKQMGNSQAQAVTGIGDQAVMVQDVLYVQSGSSYFSIAVVTGASGTNAGDVAKVLATQALNKLNGK